MKLLMIYCKKFAFNPTTNTLGMDNEKALPGSFENVQTAFMQVEEEDEERESEVVKKVIKNLKWVCGKNQSRKVILHSFAHLSDSKADPEFTLNVFKRVEERMENAGYEVVQTPFGFFLDLQLDAPGFSLARVFKSF